MFPDMQQVYQRLDRSVRKLRGEMIDFTRELVAVASENPPGSKYREAVHVIESRLEQLGLSFERLPYRAGRGGRDASGAAVVLGGLGSGRRTLYFSGHYDVVPAITPEQCTPVLRGKALFGRGAADMKGGLAAMLYAVVALRDAGVRLDGRVTLVFVPDEETGGRRGSAFLAATNRLGADGIGMLTPEPTSGVVWNANRGAVTVRVTVHGREAHVGLLHQGRNAFEDALRVVADLQRLGRRVARRRSLMLLGGRVEAGVNFNVVPARCMFTVDRRMNPDEDFERERQALLDVFADARRAGVSLDVEVLQEGRPSGTPASTALGAALSTHVRAVTGKPPKFEMCPGLLEIRFYADRGMPAYAYGPGLLAVSHGPKEFVHTDRIVECAAVYARTAAVMLSGEVGSASGSGSSRTPGSR